MVFQDHALFPHMTVRDNVAYGLCGPRGLDRARAADRADEVLSLVGLADAGDRRPGALSGGEQQRVALARALAPRPDVLLLDEPLASLDAVLRRDLRAEVRGVLRRAGTAALLVTHDQREALFFGDRVAVMRAGRIEQAGCAEDLFDAPATPFVATFLGGADIVAGRVEGGRVRTEIGDLALNGAPAGPAEEGGALEVVVRRDDLDVEADPAGTARVLDRHFQGTHYLYKVGLPSGRTVRVLAPHTRRLEEGSPVRVRLAPGHPLPAFAGGRSIRVG
jgi:iron(III) transport system ATP-binding protein